MCGFVRFQFAAQTVTAAGSPLRLLGGWLRLTVDVVWSRSCGLLVMSPLYFAEPGQLHGNGWPPACRPVQLVTAFILVATASSLARLAVGVGVVPLIV